MILAGAGSALALDPSWGPPYPGQQAPLEVALGSWQGVSAVLSDTLSALRAEVAKLDAGWSGPAADRFAAWFGETADQMASLLAQAGNVQAAIAGLLGELPQVATAIVTASGEVETMRESLPVMPSGGVDLCVSRDGFEVRVASESYASASALPGYAELRRLMVNANQLYSEALSVFASRCQAIADEVGALNRLPALATSAHTLMWQSPTATWQALVGNVPIPRAPFLQQFDQTVEPDWATNPGEPFYLKAVTGLVRADQAIAPFIAEIPGVGEVAAVIDVTGSIVFAARDAVNGNLVSCSLSLVGLVGAGPLTQAAIARALGNDRVVTALSKQLGCDEEATREFLGHAADALGDPAAGLSKSEVEGLVSGGESAVSAPTGAKAPLASQMLPVTVATTTGAVPAVLGATAPPEAGLGAGQVGLGSGIVLQAPAGSALSGVATVTFTAPTGQVMYQQQIPYQIQPGGTAVLDMVTVPPGVDQQQITISLDGTANPAGVANVNPVDPTSALTPGER